MNEITIYKKKVKNFKKIQNFKKFNKFQNRNLIFQNFKKFQKFHKISKFSRVLCNKTITTLELDQYEVLWSRVQQY